MTRHDPETMCPERLGRRFCTMARNHEGQCGYASGVYSTTRWWGANERPVGWTGDYNHTNWNDEVWRLRRLCDDHGIEWRIGITPAGDHAKVVDIPPTTDERVTS